MSDKTDQLFIDTFEKTLSTKKMRDLIREAETPKPQPQKDKK
jgi:hypothetical protein